MNKMAQNIPHRENSSKARKVGSIYMCVRGIDLAYVSTTA